MPARAIMFQGTGSDVGKSLLVAAADLVTDMTLVKHHFAAGVKAQPGIEF